MDGPPPPPPRFGLVTDCELPPDGVRPAAAQRWAVDAAKGTVSQGALCLAVSAAAGGAVPGGVVAIECDGSASQRWLGLATLNLSLAAIRSATLYPSPAAATPAGSAWFEGPLPGSPMDQKTGRRCGANTRLNDTSSPLCRAQGRETHGEGRRGPRIFNVQAARNGTRTYKVFCALNQNGTRI